MSLLPRRSILRTPFLLIVAAVVFTGTTGTVAFAQHGGGHVGGGHLGGGHVAGGHFSGGHMSASHGSASPRSHGMVSRASGDPPLAGFGTRSFVATPPPVRLSPRPGANRPIVGNRVTMLPFLPSQAEPQTGATHTSPVHFPRRPRFPQGPVFPTFAPRTFGFLLSTEFAYQELESNSKAFRAISPESPAALTFVPRSPPPWLLLFLASFARSRC